MNQVNIGLLGVGTVGGGVVEILHNNAEIIKKRLGFDLKLASVCSKSIDGRVEDIVKNIATDSYKDLFREDIDIVIELVGGYDFAKEFILEAIENRKSIVTANKALLARYGFEIFSQAFKEKVDVGYEAAVAGGIPIIKAIKESLSANNINSIKAIINGTCNYILTEMFKKGISFEKAVEDAQQKGFAEADPTFDIDGMDSAHKMAILSSISFGDNVTENDVFTEGIRGISLLDIKFADEFGYTIKLLGITKLSDDKIDVRVHPTMVKKDDVLAKTDGEYNAIKVQCDMADDTVYIGKGAGSLPTASAIVADVMDIARNIKHDSPLRIPLMSFPFNYVKRRGIKNINSLETGYYLRFSVEDSAGVLSKISGILGEHGISIKSVVQLHKGEDWVPLIVVTHRAKEQNIQNALNTIHTLDVVKSKTLLIRIDDE